MFGGNTSGPRPDPKGVIVAVTDAAIQAIRQMIIDGELQPGDRLPPEKQLSERLGLSRNSLREAVKALTVIRVLDVRQGDGTYVTSLDPSMLLDVVAFVLDLGQDHTVMDSLAVRRLLEPEATALSTTRLSAEELDEIEQTMAGLNSESTVTELVEADLAFHSVIYRACGNPYLSSLLDSLANATQRARVWRGHTQEGSVTRTIDEHREILAALRAGNAELARAWALIHVSGVELWLAATTGDHQPPRS